MLFVQAGTAEDVLADLCEIGLDQSQHGPPEQEGQHQALFEPPCLTTLLDPQHAGLDQAVPLHSSVFEPSSTDPPDVQYDSTPIAEPNFFSDTIDEILHGWPEHPIVQTLRRLHREAKPWWFNLWDEERKLYLSPGEYDWQSRTGLRPEDIERTTASEYKELERREGTKLRDIDSQKMWMEMDVQEEISNRCGAFLGSADIWTILGCLGLTARNSGSLVMPRNDRTAHTVERTGEAPRFYELKTMDILTSGFTPPEPHRTRHSTAFPGFVARVPHWNDPHRRFLPSGQFGPPDSVCTQHRVPPSYHFTDLTPKHYSYSHGLLQWPQ